MNVLYHLTLPQPDQPELDAVMQEVNALRSQVGGELIYVNPMRRPGSRLPERLYGLHRLPTLRQREAWIDVHHVYNAHPYAFLYLSLLRKPIVYTVTAGPRSARAPSRVDRLAALARIVVSSERDQHTLQGWGLRNVEVVHPGIDVARFTPQPEPSGPGLTLLSGSAPWTLDQFESKGVETLLEAVQARPDLRLILLWRGLHIEEIERRVAHRGLTPRVTIVNQEVNVNAILARAHAAVVLARDATLVKAYPHSLIEALLAGRPVLVNRAIAMADFVEQLGVGVVTETINAAAVLSALEELTRHYRQYQAAVRRLDRNLFSSERLTRTYRAIYHAAVEAKHGAR